MKEFRRVITTDDEILAMRASKGIISIIDDDPQVLQALQELISYEGYLCHSFASVNDFLNKNNEPRFPGPRCILSDMVMSEKDGLALQKSLPKNSDQPLIFMSGMATVDQAAHAFRGGALHFLVKPVNDVELFEAIEEALNKSAAMQRQQAWLDNQKKVVAKLTPREIELANILPKGLAIKKISTEMGISERAVKLYKKSIFDKLNIKTLLELITILDSGLLGPSARSAVDRNSDLSREGMQSPQQWH